MTFDKLLDKPHPVPSVMGFAYDRTTKKFPVLFRSDKVRSAKNVWSLISGLHEVGLSSLEQFAVEAKEEVNLDVVPSLGKKIGYFDAVTGDGWHWVMLLVAAPISQSSTPLINMEPDKHSELHWVGVDHFYDEVIKRPWGAGAWSAFIEYEPQIRAILSV